MFHHFRYWAHARDQKGQVSVVIALLTLTFLLFFAFVVNTGMLVNAKINLQNAADLAAYSGAAVQARQLNQISFLNYEMRRQFKRFLFRYYVIGNMAQKSHPRNGPAESKRYWSPDGDVNGNGGKDYRVPAVCITFNPNDDFCQVAMLQGIAIPPPTSLDQINESLRIQLKQIEELRQSNCEAIGLTNAMVLFLWLYNTDPELNRVIDQLGTIQPNTTNPPANPSLPNDPDDKTRKIAQAVKGLAQGLGLVPKEILLKKRIETLALYINHPHEKKVTLDKVNNKFSQAMETAEYERTIQAFLTAYHTLGPSTFDDDESIIMDELLPEATSDSANLVGLKFIYPQFDTYAIQFSLENRNQSSSDSKNCVPQMYNVPVRGQTLPVGVVKDPSILSYYALRLKAKAKVMFSPFGDVTLTAYSAARPFGSRIGPNLDETAFITDAKPAINIVPGSPEPIGKVPHLPVTDKIGWTSNQMIGSLYMAFKAPASFMRDPTAPVTKIGPEDLNRALHVAMVPNPWEKGKYNIPNDRGTDYFVKYFDDNQEPVYAFWAPIKPKDKLNEDASKEIDNMIQTLVMPVQSDGLKDGLKKGLQQYIFGNLMMGDRGDQGESYSYIHIANPFYYPPEIPSPGGGVGPIPGANPGVITLSNPALVMNSYKDIKSSWNDISDAEFKESGRVGYSVKFISFRSLRDRTIASDGSIRPRNGLDPDMDLEKDLQFLQH